MRMKCIRNQYQIDGELELFTKGKYYSLVDTGDTNDGGKIYMTCNNYKLQNISEYDVKLHFEVLEDK